MRAIRPDTGPNRDDEAERVDWPGFYAGIGLATFLFAILALRMAGVVGR